MYSLLGQIIINCSLGVQTARVGGLLFTVFRLEGKMGVVG